MTDLFSYSGTDADPSYLRLADPRNPDDKLMRQQLSAMWSKFRDFSDDQFVKEFATTSFYQRYWEMYLGATLRNAGADLVRARIGPDICIKFGEKVTWIEAICPTVGSDSHPDQVPKLRTIHEGGHFQTPPNNEISLRILSALHEKARKLNEYKSKGIIKQNEPFIIAVSGCSLDHWCGHKNSFEHLLRALLPIGQQMLLFDRNTMKITDVTFEYLDKAKKRSTGIEIDKNFLVSDYSIDISGFIWSSRRPGNLLDNVWGEDFVLIRNPNARNELTDKFPHIGREIHLKTDNFTIVDYRSEKQKTS